MDSFLMIFMFFIIILVVCVVAIVMSQLPFAVIAETIKEDEE